MRIRYEKVILILNYSALLVLCRRRAEGVFLNLFMTNPLHVEADVVAESIDSDDRRSLDHEPIEADDRLAVRHHPKDVRASSSSSPSERDANRRQAHDQSPLATRFNDHGGSRSNCEEDRECQIGMYCDRHYGLCKPYRTMGQLCRRDSQCALGYDCMFGRCLVASKPGHRGARCSSDRDCLSSLCCARQHGEKVCKPKLKLGQSCFVPDGGLPYWGNDMCPCDEGLICRYAATEVSAAPTSAPLEDSSQDSRQPISGDWFNVWTDQNQMRCVTS